MIYPYYRDSDGNFVRLYIGADVLDLTAKWDAQGIHWFESQRDLGPVIEKSYSPSPWRAPTGTGVQDANGHAVAVVHGTIHDGQLIKAAPTLLKHLTNIIDAWDNDYGVTQAVEEARLLVNNLREE